MWELLTGEIPWKGMDIVQIIQQVKQALLQARHSFFVGLVCMPIQPTPPMPPLFRTCICISRHSNSILRNAERQHMFPGDFEGE